MEPTTTIKEIQDHAKVRKTKLLRLKALNKKIDSGKATRKEVIEAIDIKRWAKADREAEEERNRNFKPKIAWTTGGCRGNAIDAFAMGMARFAKPTTK